MTTTRSHIGERWPRGMRRDVAAQYVGVSASKFDDLLAKGYIPRPKLLGGIKVWDRYSLDAIIDALPDTSQESDGWEDYRNGGHPIEAR